MNQKELHYKSPIPGTTFVNMYFPSDDVAAEETRSPLADIRSICTFEGPPFLCWQLSPPTAPVTLPDIVKLKFGAEREQKKRLNVQGLKLSSY